MTLAELLKKYNEKLERFNKIKMDESVEMTEVRALSDELKDLKSRIELAQEERELKLNTLEIQSTPIENVRHADEPKEVRDLSFDELDKEYEKTFLRAIRGKKISQRDRDVFNRMVELRDAPNATPYMKTAVDEDGGFIVPKAISTMINEYKRQGQFDLTTLVDVTVTTVISGRFTYQKLADAKPMPKLNQWDTIKDGETPQFEQKEYKIEDYAEIIPLPRTLLQDTDQNLMKTIASWIALKTLITRNNEILSVLKATYSTKKKIATVDDLKDVINVELDPAFKPNATIITNEYGFNYLAKLKDNDGNYLMQPDPTQADSFNVLGKRVIEVTSKTLPSTGTKAPMIVGDLKEAIRFFDRGVYEVLSTTIGGDSFKRDSLDTRVIDRFDVIALDPEAVIYGEVETKATTASA